MGIKMDHNTAARFFSEWEALCREDGGALWGVDLHTPFVFIDIETREAIANQPDKEGIFTKQSAVYVGKFPQNQVIAASATEFGGQRWAMAPWDFISGMDDITRLDTMVHEAFHCIQPRLLGAPLPGGDNSHMDETETRILFLLEMFALIKALEFDGEPQRAAIKMALAARQRRRAERTNNADKYGTGHDASASGCRTEYKTDANENAFEISEGTAVYTAIKLAVPDHTAQINYIANYAHNAKNMDSLAGYFGYVSGALYGLVLDVVGADWRHQVRRDTDLGGLLTHALGIAALPPWENLDPEFYGYSEAAAAVREKEAKHAARIKEFTEIFTRQPTLRMHESGQKSINGQILPIAGLGTVLKGSIEYIGKFGRMNVTDGVFLTSSGFIQAEGAEDNRVPAVDVQIEGNQVSGKNWIVTLEPGWEIHPDAQGYILREGGTHR